MKADHGIARMGEHRVLVVGPAWVGDMVMAHALVQTVLQRHPAASIDMVAPSWSLPLVERMPGVQEAIALPLGHGEFRWLKRRQIGRSLIDKHYQQAIVIPRSFKSALVPFHARIPVRTGFVGETRYGLLNDIRPLDKTVLNGTAKRYTALGLTREETLPEIIPHPVLRVSQSNTQSCLEKFAIDTSRVCVALMPGAEYGPAKQWPVDAFRQVARAQINQGRQVLVFGSNKEHGLGEHIVADLGQDAKNLCGQTSLCDAIDLLSVAGAAVSNDSGLMHVAAAVGAPVVALYGSSSPQFTPPLTHQSHILYQNLSCSPCFARECPLGHTRCLTEIQPASVDAAINRLIQRVHELI